MKNNIKNILPITLLTIISGSMGITPFVSLFYKDNTLIILLIYLVLTILCLVILSINEISIKELINNPISKVFAIIFLLLSIIYYFCLLGVFINNLFYIITPMTISLSVIIILLIILSLNKRVINVNLFFILSIITTAILLFFIFFFPSSNTILKLDNLNFNNILFSSYILLFNDLIFYKLYFPIKTTKKSSKVLIISTIIAFILLIFYAYLDLTITNINYTNTPFNNILKYLLVFPSSNIYFDLLYFFIIVIFFIYKILIFNELLRIILLKKKSSTYYLISYLLIFLFANTLINLSKNEINLLNKLLEILICCSIILFFSIGGTRIVKKLYK